MASEAGTRHASDVNLASEDPAISYAYCTPYIPYNPATSTPLEHYIHLAEEEVEIERKSTAPIFSNQLVASRLYTDTSSWSPGTPSTRIPAHGLSHHSRNYTSRWPRRVQETKRNRQRACLFAEPE
jgi:hypothetical protein